MSRAARTTPPPAPASAKASIRSVLRDSHAWLTVVILAAGLWFAIVQTGRIRESLDASTWLGITTQMMDLDRSFIEKPHLQRYFFSGVDIRPNDKDYPEAYAQANLMLDFMESEISLGRYVNSKSYGPEAWAAWYEYQFTSSPILCAVMRDNAPFYGPRLQRSARTHCGRRMKARPSAPR